MEMTSKEVNRLYAMYWAQFAIFTTILIVMCTHMSDREDRNLRYCKESAEVYSYVQTEKLRSEMQERFRRGW